MSNDIKNLADVQPGGRVRLGDQAERARFEAWIAGRGLDITRWSDGSYTDVSVALQWFAWQEAALAARQPVGEPVGWYTEDHLTDRSATTYDCTVADRWRAKGWPVAPLYAAPAQAVDLERFRGTVKSQYSMTEWMHRCGFVSAEKLEESKKNHDHLMALIDSKAVGK
ncbi:hypothetical protein [Stenotrophomonas maltophilia]|uniref:hypothetical protein n=1 Tax=Stenotrophomonas maltophilia TaxID=40324 RepID=UPI0021C59A46|nr:hypothetical protein [Stenotrophomonas maltophilia]MCU1068717.1 hypothetical protein [Stenotrophomonas maltophilia]MCU1075328.1 hypothetical protein [Stenotrophomonas maltophilia]